MRALLLFLVLLMPLSASAYCFQDAGQRYRLDPLILEAIGIWESRLQQHAIGLNRDENGKVISKDYGVMQINTVNADRLIQMGVISSPEDLLEDACFNVQAGAWVLAQHLRICGSSTWRCLGSYNAGHRKSERQEGRRLHYAQNIRTIYNRLKTLRAKPAKFAIR